MEDPKNIKKENEEESRKKAEELIKQFLAVFRGPSVDEEKAALILGQFYFHTRQFDPILKTHIMRVGLKPELKEQLSKIKLDEGQQFRIEKVFASGTLKTKYQIDASFADFLKSIGQKPFPPSFPPPPRQDNKSKDTKGSGRPLPETPKKGSGRPLPETPKKGSGPKRF